MRSGAQLARGLSETAEAAHAIANTLAPDGPGPGVRFHEYGESLRSPKKHIAYQARFSDIEELFGLLEAGDPGALELGLELLGRIEPEACVPVAALLLPHSPWNMLGAAIGRALGRCGSEASFRLLIDHPAVPYLRSGLATNGYAGGVAQAWQLVSAVDFEAGDLDPRTREATLPAFSYLLRHDRCAALDQAVRLLDSSGANPYVSHALYAIGTDGKAMLLDDLDRAPVAQMLRFSQKLAVKILLERDAAHAIDSLGGEAFLASPEGRPRLVALLDWLRDDTWVAKKPPGVGPSWLAADPRFAQLCVGLQGDADRELASLARDLVATESLVSHL